MKSNNGTFTAEYDPGHEALGIKPNYEIYAGTIKIGTAGEKGLNIHVNEIKPSELRELADLIEELQKK